LPRVLPTNGQEQTPQRGAWSTLHRATHQKQNNLLLKTCRVFSESF